MSGDSNRVRKAHSRWLESFEVGTNRRIEDDHIISFGPIVLEEVTTPHEDALVIRVTIANYKVTHIFMGLGSSYEYPF